MTGNSAILPCNLPIAASGQLGTELVYAGVQTCRRYLLTTQQLDSAPVALPVLTETTCFGRGVLSSTASLFERLCIVTTTESAPHS